MFIKLVQAELRVGQVSSVQSTQLIQGAQNSQTALGCTVAVSGNGISLSSLSASGMSSINQTQSQQAQTTAPSPSLLQPQSQYPYPYSIQHGYRSQYPQSQLTQRQQLPPVANAGISQTVNENTKVTLDGRASYSPTGGVVVAYQWTQLATVVPVVLTGVNTTSPTLTTPIVPTDTVLAFSLRVMDNHGAISSNPSRVYVMVKHHFTGGTTGGVPSTGFHHNSKNLPLSINAGAISLFPRFPPVI